MGETSDEPLADAPPSQPLRVAWVAGSETFHRYARALQPLAIGLMDELIDAVILAPTSLGGRAEMCLPFPVVSYRLPRWWPLRPGCTEPLAAELRRRRVELLHGLGGTAARLTGTLARQVGAEYLLSIYSLDAVRGLGPIGRAAAALLAASEPIRQALLAARAAEPQRIRLMRPGVYHARRPACFSDPDHSVAIVAGGPMRDFAAFDAVLSCFAELVTRKADCVFFLLGSGPAERPLRRQAERLGLRRHLTFAAGLPIEELTGIFKAADVYIAPVRQRRVDMQSLLAMAAGVPVLAAAGSGADDFILDGKTAITFRQGQAAELTMKVLALLDDYASARALAEGAIEYIRANHSPAAKVAALVETYRSIARAAPVAV